MKRTHIRCKKHRAIIHLQTNNSLFPDSPEKATVFKYLTQLTLSGYTKERSSIVVIGLSVHSTPVEMREKLAIPEAEWPQAIAELCGLNHIEEAAVLSTCNRMEIYVVALSQHRGVKEVTEWMSKVSSKFASDNTSISYCNKYIE